MVDPSAFRHGRFEQIPVEAEALRSVIQNHQIPEFGKGPGKRDRSIVNRHGAGVFWRGDLNSIGRRPAAASWTAESAQNGTGHRPVEFAAERPQRQCCRLGGRFANCQRRIGCRLK